MLPTPAGSGTVLMEGGSGPVSRRWVCPARGTASAPRVSGRRTGVVHSQARALRGVSLPAGPEGSRSALPPALRALQPVSSQLPAAQRLQGRRAGGRGSRGAVAMAPGTRAPTAAPPARRTRATRTHLPHVTLTAGAEHPSRIRDTPYYPLQS